MFLLHEWIGRHAEAAPEGIALIEGERTLTFAELERRVAAGASLLSAADLAPGDRALILCRNSIDTVVAIWSTLRAGGVIVPVGADDRPARIRGIADDCGARLTIAPEKLAASIDGVKGITTTFAAIERVDLDLAAIIYTSGTSGEPKGVMLAHRNLTNTSAAIAQYLGQRADDITCCVLPLNFSYGLFQLFVAGMVGSSLLLEPSFAFPFDVLRRIRQYRATMLPGVPTLFARLLGMLPLEGIDLGSLRLMTNAAAAIPPAHVLRLAEAFPRVRFFAMYGQTECTRATYLDPALSTQFADSVGRAIPNCEAYLVDEHHRRLPNGSEGELVIRGANVMRGYWGRAEQTAAKLIAGPLPGERVLLTGDRFRTDAQGLLYFISRNDDIFKCRGEKVAPAAIEHVLYQMPGIAEAAVVGVEDASDGMAIKAIIVPVEGQAISEQVIRKHCRAHLDPAFMPKFIEMRGALPKTASGKLLRRALTEEAAH
ncbi:MAG: long-chain fatty acid--CoA ligase [Steroidobacteraceae bacterium]|jgi:acyl-CoA synthetase (AMP-forming)/AMP-acid ligase II|nr:long-chain fatty acid--CoA ligase [Steroidobacteraceae bacterium]